MAFLLLALLLIIASVLCVPHPRDYVYEKFRFVTREQWGGRPSVEILNLTLPVPFVIIHHTYIPGACFSFDECSKAMRHMQDFHQLDLDWGDIGYSFAIGSDGAVYEGRGWSAVGAHAFGYNSRSIGIALIGDWVSQLPPQIQLDATKSLIEEGVKLGYISDAYDLVGHQQVTPTECPGKTLFEEISTWDRFSLDVPS